MNLYYSQEYQRSMREDAEEPIDNELESLADSPEGMGLVRLNAIEGAEWSIDTLEDEA